MNRIVCMFVAAAAACISWTAVATSANGSSVAQSGNWGFNRSDQDLGIRPGDDFFRYANGGYLDRMVMPEDRPRYGALDMLRDQSEQQVHAILEEAAAQRTNSPATVNSKLGAFYRAYMDTTRIEQLGGNPMKSDLMTVRSAGSKERLAEIMGAGAKGFESSVVLPYIEQDQKEPDRYSLYLVQGGLALPDRDYYLESRFAALKVKYRAYVEQALSLIQWPQAGRTAQAVVDFETSIASVSWPAAARRDSVHTYNPTTLSAFERSAPGFPWRSFLRGADLGDTRQIVVMEDTALLAIARLYARTPIGTLRAWQAFHIVNNAAPFLSQSFAQPWAQFHEMTLRGQTAPRARWKMAVAGANRAMGEAIGQIYVARHFPPASKIAAERLVMELREAFRARLEKLEWMTPAAKTAALEKLDNYTIKIGYPDKWRDYSQLRIDPNDLYGNVKRGEAFEWASRVARLKQPVDRSIWGMTPQTVNAYYNPSLNEVVFPAALLQPPIFTPGADPAINFGSLGGIIGHEMTHGFDDEGRKYDAKGRLAEWWTPVDTDHFQARAAQLGTQYSKFEPLPGMHINAELTMGENIADLGALNLALDAYQRFLQGKEAPVIDNFSGVQRVFLGFAQLFRAKTREAALRRRLVTDIHSPDEYRLNGVVRNIDAWYEAFDVKPTDKLYIAPEARVRIW